MDTENIEWETQAETQVSVKVNQIVIWWYCPWKKHCTSCFLQIALELRDVWFCAETEILWASFQHAGDQHTLIHFTLRYEYSLILNFWS